MLLIIQLFDDVLVSSRPATANSHHATPVPAVCAVASQGWPRTIASDSPQGGPGIYACDSPQRGPWSMSIGPVAIAVRTQAAIDAVRSSTGSEWRMHTIAR